MQTDIDLRRDALLHSIEVFNKFAEEELSRGRLLCDSDNVASYDRRLDDLRNDLNALVQCLGEGDTLASQSCRTFSLSLAAAGPLANTAYAMYSKNALAAVKGLRLLSAWQACFQSWLEQRQHSLSCMQVRPGQCRSTWQSYGKRWQC